MEEITLNNKKYLLVEVPNGIRDIQLHGASTLNFLLYYESDGYAQNLKIPEYSKLIGKISDIAKDKDICEGLIESIMVEEMPSPYNDMGGGYHYAYVDYNNIGEYAGWQGDAGCFNKATDSFKSWLELMELDLTKEYLLIQKL